MSEISDYLKEMRLSKRPKPSRAAVSREISLRYEGTRSRITISDDIAQFENGHGGLQDALSGKEPYRTIFLLYIKTLEPGEEEKGKIKQLILEENPKFDFESRYVPPPRTYAEVFARLSRR